tara:strand:- start:816 stop:1109 length:294 start_codon:yes stop_codon:yes gene_type:complete
MSDSIFIEQREYHSTTHYINREISKEEIIKEFGDIDTFKKGLLEYQHEDYDEELNDKVHDFLSEFDYDRHVDEWSMRKGGYDVEIEVVDKFTMTEDR